MKRIMVILSVLIMAGCIDAGKEGLATEKTNNEQFEITLLFEHDSCKVYRFRDGSRYKYFVKCKQSDATTEWSETRTIGRRRQTVDISIPTTNQ